MNAAQVCARVAAALARVCCMTATSPAAIMMQQESTHSLTAANKIASIINGIKDLRISQKESGLMNAARLDPKFDGASSVEAESPPFASNPH